MKRKMLLLAGTAAMLAAPAQARDGQWYVQGDAGVMIVEDIDFDIDGFDNDASVDHDVGYDFGALFGYDFGGFRLEAEASYREADIDGVNAGSQGVALNNGTTGVLTGSNDAGGDTNALSFMVNGLLDFGPDDSLQGYVGGGVGVARVDTDVRVFSNTPSALDDSDTGFAWQVLAGVRAPLTDSLDVGVKYRYFNATSLDIIDPLGRDFEGDFTSHSVLGTFTYNFGGEAPPPPEPAACNTGPYIVFFDFDESAITPEAATILNNAVTAYANCGSASVMLAGHTDTVGSQSYNLDLAARRNASVRDYLTGRGVPGGRISSEAFGESDLRVPTADGVRELQNRRVEVTYGPGSGM
jgi:outer membrane protein OmpA-like peptidoglycan-associated protein